MGKRGPPKTPAAVKQTRGTVRKDRDTLDSARGLKPSVPKPPAHLKPDVKAVWNALGPKLAAHGLLTELDAIGFEVLCQAYCDTISSVEELAKEDVIISGPGGVLMANPRVNITGKTLTTLKWALGQFGATPAARNGIRQASDRQDSIDAMDELLNG